VDASLVQRGVDAVAQPVGLLVGQCSLQVVQDDSDQDVLLVGPDAEPGDGLRWESVPGRLGQDRHLLDGVGVEMSWGRVARMISSNC
jgi:hypothetical protein